MEMYKFSSTPPTPLPQFLDPPLCRIKNSPPLSSIFTFNHHHRPPPISNSPKWPYSSSNYLNSLSTSPCRLSFIWSFQEFFYDFIDPQKREWRSSISIMGVRWNINWSSMKWGEISTIITLAKEESKKTCKCTEFAELFKLASLYHPFFCQCQLIQAVHFSRWNLKTVKLMVGAPLFFGIITKISLKFGYNYQFTIRSCNCWN